MTIGTFIIVKNESSYIGYHIMSLLNDVNEMVFADGCSTDGTLEIIDYIKKKYDKDNKIKLFLDKDCKNLQEDYVSLFNWTMQQVKSDYAWFCHPDMICLNPYSIQEAIKTKGIRYNVGMTSIAGDKREKKFTDGRTDKWASIFRNSYGLHYYGNYGTTEEDCYFSDFTGDVHTLYRFVKYLPYSILESGIKMVHYCDCKPYDRRYGRMLSCLKNLHKDAPVETLEQMAREHPRVSLEDGTYGNKAFRFEPNDIKPEVFEKYREEFEPLRRM